MSQNKKVNIDYSIHAGGPQNICHILLRKKHLLYMAMPIPTAEP